MMHAEHKEPRTDTNLATDMPEGEEAPPRFTKLMGWLRWLLLALALGAAAYTNVTYFFTDSANASASAKYYCPMHPQITSNQRGECPICHMSLELIPTDRLSGEAAHDHAHAHGDHAHHDHGEHGHDMTGKYICPMCPSVVSDKPGDCPICHMALEPAGEGAKDEAAGKYVCPMCPSVVSDKPGDCPICHMALEPAGEGAKGEAPAKEGEAKAEEAHEAHDDSHESGLSERPKYTCPMHPEIIEDKPGRCPICRMYLEPMHKGEGGAGDMPRGTVPVVLGFDRVQAIGMRTSVVGYFQSEDPLKVTATVSAPEEGQAFVHTRAPGYVERALVEQTGTRVRRGQELLSIYSPEIYQAQAELLAAQRWKGQDGVSAQAAAARTKLELLGLAPRTIDRIVESGKPMRAVPITSPVNGFVVKKNAALGSYVTPEMTLFEIVDLSRVNITAEVYQRDAHRIRLGGEARFLLAGREDNPIVGKIDLIYPTLSPKERTTRIRMQVKNADAALRPGDYGTIELSADARNILVLPREGVIDTGEATYVFVVEGEGRYVPRTVSLGADYGNVIEVKAGVWEGEKVVSSATFLIDSESRLQASLAGPGASHDPHAGHGH